MIPLRHWKQDWDGSPNSTSTTFTAKEIFEKQKAEGIKRKLVGFEMIERGIPRHDYITIKMAM